MTVNLPLVAIKEIAQLYQDLVSKGYYVQKKPKAEPKKAKAPAKKERMDRLSADTVKAIFTAKNTTIRALGEKFGIGASTVSKIRTGKAYGEITKKLKR